MVLINARINIYNNTALFYEGEPPADLNVELFYTNEDAKFQVESTVSLSGSNNKVTINGELDDSPVSEVITVTGTSTEGSAFFDLITSVTFSFETPTNIKITSLTSNGDDNKVLSILHNNVAVRVRELRWTKNLQEQGIVFEKSRMVYIPLFVTLDSSNIIEYFGDNYSIFSITRGLGTQEVLITRLD